MNKSFFEKGKKDALRDIQAENLKVKTFGTIVTWFQEWRKILLNEYNVEIEVVSGCVVSDETVEYVNGYNKISEAEIKKKFGEDIFEKTLDEAEAIWKQESYFPKPVENINEEMTAIPNKFNWVKCPNCNISFKITSVSSWNGKIHLSCGQKIKIIEIKY